ncbi:MAG: FkbM family methyltransferase [Betaproteobacteria bacterium]
MLKSSKTQVRPVNFTFDVRVGNFSFMQTMLFLERVLAYLQGKGYGAATIDREVSHALELLGSIPRTVLDVGANNGLWTKQLLSHYPEVVVHVFEPQPLCYSRLLQMYAGRPNVHIYNNAVSNAAGVRSLYFDREGSGLASLSRRKLDHLGIQFSESIEVNAVVLDEFLSANDVFELDIVKFDIEGHEFAAFEGMAKTLSGPRPPKVIQFEFGGCNIDTRTFFRDFYLLFSDFYDIYRQTPFGLLRIDRYMEADECFRTTNYFLRLKV